MKIDAVHPDDYVEKVPEERKAAFQKLRQLLRESLPQGFEETMQYGMVSYVVPKSMYPPGYHTGKGQPLPFIALASQKNSITLYHMALYTRPELLQWFQEAYPHHSAVPLDMGKSCIHFKKTQHIPFDLIAELAEKMTPQQWIEVYEAGLKK